MTFEDVLWLQGTAGVPSFSAREDRQLIAAFFATEGVLSGMVVTQRGAGANMSVDIAAGRCVIQGDDQGNQGMYIVNNISTDNVAIGAAPGSNSRIDLVYVRVNDPNATGPSGNNATYGVVAGTVDANPVPPAVPTSAIPLCQVLVASGTASITNAMITERRRLARTTGRPPLGISYDFRGPEANCPGDFLLENGQAVSRATYFELFAIIGTTYGSGDGSTTFNVPDSRGRVNVCLDNMGGTDAGRLTVTNTLGGVGGEELHTLSVAELAAHTHAGVAHTHSMYHTHTINHDHPSVASSYTSVDHTHDVTPGGGFTMFIVQSAPGPNALDINAGTGAVVSSVFQAAVSGATSTSHSHNVDLAEYLGSSGGSPSDTGSATVATASNGSSTAHNNMQPYILCNKIISAL